MQSSPGGHVNMRVAVNGMPIRAAMVMVAAGMLLTSACDAPNDRTSTPTIRTEVEPTATAQREGKMAAYPADLRVEYDWRAGTMPPPHHYEYTVSIGPGTQGKVVFWPDYPS